MNRLTKLGILASLFALLAACSAPEVVKESSRTPMSLSITPGFLRNGDVNTPYTFTLQGAGLKGRSEQATFKWSFSGGAAGEEVVTVVDGKASVNVQQSFAAAGVYGLVASVETGTRAATSAAVVSIGDATPEREAELASCGDWVSKKEGAYGVTIDRWDISAIPAGAVFDIKFDTISIPDRIVVEYPDGAITYDSGWRGAAKYDGGPLYPGGVIGSATGEASGIFTKAGQDEFTVTVFGPDLNTKWSYEIQCRTPGR